MSKIQLAGGITCKEVDTYQKTHKVKC